MTKLKVIIVLCLCMTLFLGCEDLRATARKEKIDSIHIAFERTTDIEIERQKTTITSALCEGSRVAASMILSEAGKSPELSNYRSVDFSEVFDIEGNRYPVVVVDGEVIIPDRYKLN